MLITCRGCGKQLPIDHHFSGSQIRCGGCKTLIDVPVSQPIDVPSVSRPVAPPLPVRSHKSSSKSISDKSIIITAASCLFGLILVIGAAILWISLTKDPVQASVEVVPEEVVSKTKLAEFEEGYTMMLPNGFKQASREETERGYVVYRFRSEEGYRFTLAIIPNESIDRFTTPPKDFSSAHIKSVRELSEGLDVEVQPMRVTADDMPASVFRYYEKETYRGVNFVYFMVAMDHGRKLVMKMAGKYGGYSEEDENITMPSHWYDALLTLRRVRRS